MPRRRASITPQSTTEHIDSILVAYPTAIPLRAIGHPNTSDWAINVLATRISVLLETRIADGQGGYGYALGCAERLLSPSSATVRQLHTDTFHRLSKAATAARNALSAEYPTPPPPVAPAPVTLGA